MLRYLGIFALILLFIQSGFSQNVTGTHDVQSGSEPNEYNIKTTIEGLQGVDIARIKYIVDNKHTYKASPNNGLFSDRNEQYIKFYIMAVPATGILSIELGIIISDEGAYKFPVEFQFSRDEEKQTINLAEINISGTGVIASEETPEPVVEVAPVVEEVPEVVEKVEEQPVMEEVIEPVVEVAPVVEETPEVVEKVEEQPIVEEVIEPVVEVAPVVEETPEVVEKVEEEPVVEEVIEPVVEVAPVVEETPEVVERVEEEPVVEEVIEPVVEAAPVVEETLEVIETPAPVEEIKSNTKYTVQLLSLAKFSQSRLNYYCKQHKLSLKDLKKNQVGGLMKITCGEANSVQEANQLMKKLMQDYNIDDAFVTPMK